MTLPATTLKAMAGFAGMVDNALASILADADPTLVGFCDDQRYRAVHDLLALGDGKDCCYDRPGVGAAYASWYQPRRVHECLRVLAPMVARAGRDHQPVHVVDLGAGTGATTWAIQISLAALRASGQPLPPAVRIDALDASPPMLRVGDRLVETFHHLGDGCTSFSYESHLALWDDARQLGESRGCWLVAGHLFDARDVHFASLVANRLCDLADVLLPGRLVLIGPAGKAAVQHAVEEALHRAGGEVACPDQLGSIFARSLPVTGAARRQLYGPAGVAPALLADPAWAANGTTVQVFRHGRRARRLFKLGPRGLALDEHQDDIANPDDRMTVIIGAAGSGKSTVLVERLARTLEVPGRPRRVLVTSFNKAMVARLREWIESRLPRTRTTGAEGDWLVRYDEHTVRFLNWDKVPPRVFGVKTPAGPDVNTIRAAKKKLGIDGTEWWLDDDFLVAELRRVIYGRRVQERATYLDMERKGRRRTLPRGPDGPRATIWDVLMSGVVPRRGFTYRWLEVMSSHGEALGNGEPIVRAEASLPFTEVFIDECQDLTETDYRLAVALVGDAQDLVVTGDGAQAMHVGPGRQRPGQLRGRRWKEQVLYESYRLPLRLAEAVAPLAAQLRDDGKSLGTGEDVDVGLPTGSRSAVLGCRPVVVAAGERLEEQIHEVVSCFRALWSDDPNGFVTVAEVDTGSPLVEVVQRSAPGAVRAERMRSIKGLERACVIWLTSQATGADEAMAELVYTILTRALHVVVMVVDPPATSSGVAHALARLPSNRLLFWDAAAETAWRTVTTAARAE